MGIRFACHVCDKHLNVKRELAGRRGICPACSARFRIPTEDAEKSTPIEKVTPAASPATAVSVDAEVSPPGASAGSASVSGRHAAPVAVELRPIPLLDDDPDATWYVRPPSGGQYGPASSEVLKQWISEDRVAATALLWRDGWPQWRDAGDALPELADQLPGGDRHVPATSSAGLSLDLADDHLRPGRDRQRAEPSGLLSESALEAIRRARSNQRVVLIGILLALALLLVAVLIFVLNRDSDSSAETAARPVPSARA